MKDTPELPDEQGAGSPGRFDLDSLFRSSAEGFEPSYNPDDWERLRRRLDEHDHPAPLNGFARWGLLLVLLLLLTGGGLWYWSRSGGPVADPEIQPSASSVGRPQTSSSTAGTGKLQNSAASEPNRLPESASQTGQPLTSGPDDPSPLEAVNPTDPAPRSVSPANERLVGAPPPESASARRGKPERSLPVSTSKRPSVSPGAFSPSVADRSAPTGSPQSGGRRRVPKGSAASVTSQGLPAGRSSDRRNKALENLRRTDAYSSGEGLSAPASSGRGELTTGLNNESTVPDEASTPERWVLFPEPGWLSGRPVQFPDSLKGAVPEVSYQASALIRPQSVRRSPLGVRLVLTPDLSLIGGSGPAAAAFTMGLLVEYRLWNRLSVQAGVLRSMKRYDTAGENYEWPRYYHQRRPDRIDAVCLIYDVPVNLRYDVWQTPRYRIFISSGLTTYVMPKEDYTYWYEKPDPSIKWWGAPDKPGTERFLFSHLNLSAGYERQFSRHWAWQIEPFLKMPLGGVGYGNIRLTNIGAFASMRYSF